MLGSQGSTRHQQTLPCPRSEAWHRGPRGSHAGAAVMPGPSPRGHRLSVSVFLLEANFDKFTQRKHTLREDGEGLAASCFLNPEPELNQAAG